MNRRHLLAKVRNNPSDVRFSDLVWLVEAAGITLRRGEGSHHVYTHSDIPELLDFQRGRDGKAKPYQVRQFLAVFEKRRLTVE